MNSAGIASARISFSNTRPEDRLLRRVQRPLFSDKGGLIDIQDRIYITDTGNHRLLILPRP
jgi:hypothetical protein